MERLLKISEFAALSGISRKLLIYYDWEGILHPKYVDRKNGYRYYSYRQMETASVILAFREAGLSLESIQKYLAIKSPEDLKKIFNGQKSSLNRQIQKLEQVIGMVESRLEQTEYGIAVDAEKIWVQECTAENLFLGPKLPDDYEPADGWDYLPAFYKSYIRQGIQLGFVVGSLVDCGSLKQGLWNKVSHYYYRLPENQYSDLFIKPAGSYVLGMNNSY